MITSLYYYDHYKPYLIGEAKRDSKDGVNVSSVQKAKPKISSSNTNKDRSIYLNKSLTNNVIGYVNDFSKMVNSIKDSSRHILKDMDEMTTGTLNSKEFKETKSWLEQDIKDFVNSYNEVQKFEKGKESSKIFDEFTNDINMKVTGSMEKLESLGVSLELSGDLSFNSEQFNKLSRNNMKKAVNNSENVMFDVHQSTTKIMKEPLTRHLDFKELGYYYNYNIGGQSDPHALIGTGFIIDKSL